MVVSRDDYSAMDWLHNKTTHLPRSLPFHDIWYDREVGVSF